MLVYRLTRKKYALQLDGQGAALFGGRWNTPGKRVIYAAEHRSLAVLEYRANNPLPVKDLIMLVLQLPDDNLKEINSKDLPNQWQHYTFESPCAAIGDQWLRNGDFLAMKVPSAVVQQESNILINPMHEQMKEVEIVEALPFLIDQRMI